MSSSSAPRKEGGGGGGPRRRRLRIERGGPGRNSGSESESESETCREGDGGGLIGEFGGVSRPRENEGNSEFAIEEREREGFELGGI